MNSSKADPALRRLTTDGRLKFDPLFIKGGAEIIYTVLDTPTQTSLMRLKMEDLSTERLHPQATTSEFEPAFSADGRYYTFVQNRANLNLKLIIRDALENKDALYDPGGGFAGMRHPTIAPDNSRIVFSMANASGQQLFSVSMDGKNLKELTKTSLNHWPAFSPDGKHLAFGSSREGDFEIYIMDAGGSGVQRVTHSRGLDMRPDWSPDGKRLAFTSNRDGNYEIYVIDTDGRNTRRITHNGERDDFPSWHPDGKRLVFIGERSGRTDLYLVDLTQ